MLRIRLTSATLPPLTYMNRCVNTKDGTVLSTDATTHLAPLGNAQQYCSVFNFQLVFRGLFLQLASRCLRPQTDSVRQ
jgi:hypothetical protein